MIGGVLSPVNDGYKKQVRSRLAIEFYLVLILEYIIIHVHLHVHVCLVLHLSCFAGDILCQGYLKTFHSV